MLDIFNIPGQQDNVKIFYASDTVTWQTWTKPRKKCNFIWMMCMGGGAGGGGGGKSGTTTNSAGNGGASGAITTALFPANLLPDTLFIWVGKGGAGGLLSSTLANGSLGVTGGKSLVAVRPVTSSIYSSPGSSELICSSGRNEGTAGWTDQLKGEPGNGDSGVVLPKLITLGMWNSVNGRSRAIGDVTPLTGGTITCPGADAGDTTISTTTLRIGQSILPVNLGYNVIIPRINGGAVEGAKGGDGVWSWNPMYGTGGAGGSSISNLAGAGGKGAYGCGGGGGGGGGTTGGNGGNGGDGLVIIATF
jgi:hypothetical protein